MKRILRWATAVSVALLVLSGQSMSGQVGPGRIVYFVQNDPREFGGHIFAVNPDGTDDRRLARSLSFEGEPSLSPDKQRVAYVHDQDVFIIDLDGDNKRRLTRGPGYDLFPVWSHDGTKIAFQRGADTCGVSVIVKSVSTTEKWVVTDNSSGAEGKEAPHSPVAWSPNGSRIVFEREDSCDGGVQGRFEFDLYSAKIDGTNEERILDNASQPKWSDSRNLLAFSRGTGIFVARGDGSNQRQVLDFRPGYYDWSPSGDRIAYSTGYWSDDPSYCGFLGVVRPNGTHAHTITPAGVCTRMVAWSRSDQVLGFVGKRKKDWDIYRIRRDGENLRRLTSHDGPASYLDF